MLLKTLKLRNIRTYEEGEISFPTGAILFEGGIGSGKSTLLLAIEFALFGLGNEKGTTLLSLGRNEGSVELILEARGKEVRVHRSLVRTKKGAGVNQGVLVPGRVEQGEGWIEYEGKRKDWASTEMKEEMLKILNYNEPMNPKAKSVIFRYAVYTPQEEMKEILSQAPQDRLQTIRKALRLEEYKVARENAQVVAKDLIKSARILMERIKELPEVERSMKDLEGKVPTLQQEIDNITEAIMDNEVEIKGHKANWEDLRKRLQELWGEAKNREMLSSSLGDTLERVDSLSSRISLNKKKLGELRQKIEEITSLKKPEITMEEAAWRLEDTREELAKLTETLGTVSHVFISYSTLVEKKVCPTCNQRVDTEEYKSKLETARSELTKIKAEKVHLEKEVKVFEAAKQASDRYDTMVSSITEFKERLQDTEEQNKKDEEDLKKAETSRKDLERKVKESETAVKDYEGVKREFETNKERIEELENKGKDLESRKARKEGDLREVQNKIDNYREEKAEIEAQKVKADCLTDYANWLKEYFVIALERIEQSILATANREFDEEFSRWFSFMVEDPTKSVRVDEEFTPNVTQDAYEQEVSNLSGGERTALALAYRLALNKTVQKRVGVDSSLLILDEPTDGFSKDQIGRIGDLLQELNLVQAIIVSHERELEGAVDHIFRVYKEDGKSKVLPVNV